MTLAALSLPTPSTTAAAAAPTLPVAPPPPPVAPPPVKTASAPSTTVTLSPQALSAHAAEAGGAAPAPSHDGSIYEAIKHGLSTAATDVGDAIAGGAHAVVDGVETAVSTVHDVVKGTLELPFAVVAKACDAAGALIDEL